MPMISRATHSATICEVLARIKGRSGRLGRYKEPVTVLSVAGRAWKQRIPCWGPGTIRVSCDAAASGLS